MKRCSLAAAAFAAAVVLAPAATAATPESPVSPATPSSGSGNVGSTSGLETTGSSTTDVSAFARLGVLLFGGPTTCTAVGSALAIMGDAMMDCK
ncbi:hypothetical protein [Nocardia camponoti]|uniref:Secreted protein n=1 Tax=Nocardia camponoti TaxID=1616106 RepID=A0A917QS06_9NOCA|nr:hypothetical protein [Nocardia camponoti]GGK64794.1 hypothetical protein GCM10011591_41280 [Nocardia camponoti]